MNQRIFGAPRRILQTYNTFTKMHCEKKLKKPSLCYQCFSSRLYGHVNKTNQTYANLFVRLLSTTPKRPIKRGPVTWVSLAVFLLAGGGTVAYVRFLKQEKEKEREKERARSVGKAAIGGPFELIDTNGKVVSNEDLKGKWLLIYFGFCHCPDICPDQLEKMATVIEKIESMKNLPTLQPVFITVDPIRDTKENIKEYLKDFHPRMIGLTGSEEQVKKVCKTFRVYYSAGPRDDDDDYIVDHTIIMYLLNADGDFIDYYGQNRTIQEIVGSISTKMVMAKKKT